MLHVITVDSVLSSTRESFTSEILDQLGEGVLHYYNGKLAYHRWKDRDITLVEPDYHADGKVGSLLLEFVEEMASSKQATVKDMWNTKNHNFQLWIIGKFNESFLRKVRTLEHEGRLMYTCYTLHRDEPFSKDEKERAYEELKRIMKASQNGRIDVQWFPWDNSEVDRQKVSLLLERKYDILKKRFSVLPRETSAYVQPETETPLSQIMRQYYSDAKGREIFWFPKKYVRKVMDEEKWGVKSLPKNEQGKVKRHVLVTGTGRSGTTYFSDLLKILGLDVGHQRNGKDGCSGAEFSVDHHWYPWFPVYGGGDCANVGERRSDYTYKHVLHVVRHPLWCIPSLMRNYPAINPEFWADNGIMDPYVMDKSSIIRNATMYYYINEAIDKSNQAEYRCQLEHIHENWGTLMDILEMHGTSDPVLKPSNQASGWGRYEPLSWTQLENGIGKALTNSIRAQANRYGYK